MTDILYRLAEYQAREGVSQDLRILLSDARYEIELLRRDVKGPGPMTHTPPSVEEMARHIEDVVMVTTTCNCESMFSNPRPGVHHASSCPRSVEVLRD